MPTDGFDAASPQAGLAWRSIPGGVAFVFVKATGANVGAYVAPHYAEQHDAARLRGLHLGHTHLTGTAGTPVEQARHFVTSLRQFDRVHDCLALDNERFPDEPGSRAFTDQETAVFWREVFRLLPDVPHHHAFTYAGADYARSQGGWPMTNALGTRWWIAAYDEQADGSRGPLPQVPGCQVSIHQWTSAGHLGGVTVDRDWSPRSVEDLFGAAAEQAVQAKQALAKAQAATVRGAHLPPPHTTTDVTGYPGGRGSAFNVRLQLWARQGGYVGVLDGDPGPNTWMGVQRILARQWGYRGRIDGGPEVLTWEAIQRMLAHVAGYTGPVDGDPQGQTYRAFGRFLNTLR